MREPLETDNNVLRRVASGISLALILFGGAAIADCKPGGVPIRGGEPTGLLPGFHATYRSSRARTERQAIIQDSSNMVQDLACTLSIDVSRADLVAMTATDAWQAPAQSASCDVVTSEGSHVAKFSLAPEITLIDGKAIGVKLNAHDFEGAPPMIGKALQSYINYNAAFQDQLMDVVNQNLASWLGARKRAGT